MEPEEPTEAEAKTDTLRLALEDVLEWLLDGTVNDVHYDEDSIIESIQSTLKECK